MPVTSKHEDKMFTLQSQLRENQADLSSFLGDLDQWTSDIKTKDENLKKQKDVPSKQDLPPIRNRKDKKKKKKEKSKNGDKKEDSDGKSGKRLSSYDYRGWDKFDVDKACEDIEDNHLSDSDTDSESDEEWEKLALQQRAIEEKNKGNEHFKKGEYDLAIEWYTKGSNSDPTNALLPGNRAMALLKLEKYGAAEVDANQAIILDPLYYKAYLRRAAARVGLKKYDMAVEDYKKLLNLDPGNKVAKLELEKLEKEMNRKSQDRAPVSGVEFSEEGLVKPIYKSQEQRSKKPLKRIEIQDIGIETDTSRKTAIEKTKSTQSDKNKEITARETKMFDKFTESEPTKSRKVKVGEYSDSEVLKPTSLTDTQLHQKSRKMKIDDVISAEVIDVKCDRNIENSSGGKIKEISNYETVPPPNIEKVVKPPPIKLITPSKPSSPRDWALDRKIPATSVQFQADYKELKNDLEALYMYFKRIEPSTYPKILGEFLDSDILLNIILVLNKFFIQKEENCYDHVYYLSQVKRFSMTVMFLSKKEQEGIQNIFKYLEEKKMATNNDLEKLKKLYQL